MASKPPSDIVPSPLERRREAEQSVFMREVDEAVRQDQMSDVAKRYGLLIIGVIVAVLLAFGGWLIWHNRQEARLEQRSEELVGAIDELEAGNAVVADDELEALLADAGPASAAAARLLRAGIAAQQNRATEAIALFDEVAADDDTPKPYRDYAIIRSVSLAYDNLKPQQVIDRVGPLAVPGSAWFGSAGELVALAYLELGEEQRAGPLLAQIAQDPAAPESLRARTRQLAGLLGYDAVDDVEGTLAQLAGEGSASAPGAAASQVPPAQ